MSRFVDRAVLHVAAGDGGHGCASVHRSGRYARYYTFTVSDAVSFQADLGSPTDAYLYLLAGSGSSVSGSRAVRSGNCARSRQPSFQRPRSTRCSAHKW